MQRIPGTDESLDDIETAGNVGIGKVAKWDKRDLKLMRGGRIEESGRLRPVLAAISARQAADYRTGERQNRAAMAFENQPVLEAALNQELGDRINENAGIQFAGAAADAYDDAADSLDAAHRWKAGMQYQSAIDRARLNQSSYYDNRRQGGILQDAARGAIGAGLSLI
jgi:hypothetical protein